MMDKLVIGLLFVIACLSLLMCALIRIIVELINGSNRKPNKSHVTIMCAALCGEYKNTDGDWIGHGGIGGAAERERVEHIHHTYPQHHNPQFQHLQHNQSQLNSNWQQQQKTTAPPIADDLRITFSDVRVTEYQNNDDIDTEKGGVPMSDRAMHRTCSGHHYVGIGDEPRVTVTDMNIPAGTTEISSQRNIRFVDGEESGEEERVRSRRHTVTNQDLDGPRSSAVYFRIPSLMRRSSVRRQSSAGMGGEQTAISVTPSGIKNEVDSKEISGEKDGSEKSDSYDKKSTVSETADHDRSFNKHTLSTQIRDKEESVVKTILPNSNCDSSLRGEREGEISLEESHSKLEDIGIFVNETATQHVSSDVTGNETMGGESAQIIDPITTDSTVTESTGGESIHRIDPIPPNSAYSMIDTNHGNRLSMDSDTNSMFLEAQKCEEDIKRLQREIYEIDLLEKNERQSDGGGDKQSIQAYENEVERLQREIAELNQEMNRLSGGQQEAHTFGNYNNSSDVASGNSEIRVDDGKVSKGGGLSTFFKNPFASKKQTHEKTFSRGGKIKLSSEGAYNEGISVTGVSKEYHVDTDYASPLVGNDSDMGFGGTPWNSSDAHVRSKSSTRNELGQSSDYTDKESHKNPTSVDTPQTDKAREKASPGEEWPRPVVRKKSSMTNSGKKSGKPNKTVSFQKSMSSPIVRDESEYFDGDSMAGGRDTSISRPLVIKKSSSLQSDNRSTSGRKIKVSSNSRRSRSSSKSPSPPRQQNVTGEALWNQRQPSKSSLKLGRGRSNVMRLTDAVVDEGNDESGVKFFKQERVPFDER